MAAFSLRAMLLLFAVAAAGCADTATSPSDRPGLTLTVSSARAEMVPHTDGAARIDYTLCYAIGVANPVRRPITIQQIAFTVIRADGSSWSSSADSYLAGQRIGGGGSNALYGCRVVFQQSDVASPTAVSYRMRVEYTLDIGGASAPHVIMAEGTFAAIRATP